MKSNTVQIDLLLKENSLLKEENARLRQTLSDHNIEHPQLNSPVQEDEALRSSDSGALRESEERYNSLFKNATLGIAHCRTITDKKGVPVDYLILHVNDTYTEVTGLKKQDVEGKTAKEVFPGIENFSFDYIGNYGRIALEGGELNFEQYFEGLNQWYSIYIYSPKKYEFTAFFTDISDRKRAEAALRKSTEELKSITDNSPYIIGRFDLDFRHTFINPFGEKVYGRKREEIIGKTVSELDMPRDKALYLEKHLEELVRTGKQQNLDFEFVSPAIGNIYFHSTFVAEHNDEGAIISILAITHDITLQKRSGEAQRIREAQLDAFFANSPVILNLLDENFCYIYTDKLTPSYYGLDRESIKGKCVRELSPDFFSQTGSVMQQVLETGESVLDAPFESPIPGKMGEIAYWRTSFFRVPLEGNKWGVGVISSEITEIRRSEEKLRESESRFRLLADNISQFAWIANSEGRMEWVNKRWVDFTGLTIEDLQAEGSLSFVHPDYADQVIQSFIQALKSGESWENTHPMKGKTGEYRWFLVRALPIFDAGGKITLWFGTHTDIHEQKLAEEALKRSETILKQAETMTNLGAWEIEFQHPGDMMNNPLSWTDQVYRIFGYEPGSVTVTNELFFEHVHPEDRQKISDALAKAIDERSLYTVEHRIKRTDGIERIVIEHAEITYDMAARPERIIGSIQDITERKLAEGKLMSALAEAEEGRNTLTALMQYIPMGITIADAPDVNIRMVSRYGQELLEKSNDIITGIPAPEHPSVWGVYRSDGVTPGTPAELPLSRATMKGEIVKNEEWFVTRSDGTLIPILCNAAPILDKAGKVIGGIIGWQDIAGLKKIERELTQRNEELSRFIYTVSHDLKSPLVTIKMFSLYLREDILNQKREAQEKDLGYIENAADKMGKLLEELLELSRIGRKEEPESEIMLEPLAQSVIDLLAGRIRERNARVVITAPPVVIHGYRQRLVQVYQNLVDNALKFMGAQAEPLVEIGAYVDRDRNDEVVFFVKDNGSGIDKEFGHKVFGLFEKLDPGSEGTGIGLALVKRIIEVHEGQIWFTSVKGQGTTFFFTLGQARLLNLQPAKWKRTDYL